jgi:hypothetical protein
MGEPTPPTMAELESWAKDPALLAIARLSGKIADEPAMSRLPWSERWRPRTLTHFRMALLDHLQAKGAHTFSELVGSPPEVLGLPLRRSELGAALESARRHRLVARLDPQTGSGPASARDEWVVTEAGRRLSRRGLPWLLPHVGGISVKLLGAVGATLTILGATLHPTGFWSIFLPAMIALFVVSLVAAGAVWFRARQIGAGWAKDAVAADWTRWAEAFPDLYGKATKPFPWRWLVVSVLAIAIGVTAPFWMPGGRTWSEVVLYVGILGGWLLLLLTVGNWLTRWGDIKAALRRRRVDDLAKRVAEL